MFRWRISGRSPISSDIRKYIYLHTDVVPKNRQNEQDFQQVPQADCRPRPDPAMFSGNQWRMAFKRSAVRSRLSPPGRLAQLVAHPLDVREVTSSSLVSSTTEKPRFSVVFRDFRHYFTSWSRDGLRVLDPGWGVVFNFLSGALWPRLVNNGLLLQALLQV